MQPAPTYITGRYHPLPFVPPWATPLLLHHKKNKKKTRSITDQGSEKLNNLASRNLFSPRTNTRKSSLRTPKADRALAACLLWLLILSAGGRLLVAGCAGVHLQHVLITPLQKSIFNSLRREWALVHDIRHLAKTRPCMDTQDGRDR